MRGIHQWCFWPSIFYENTSLTHWGRVTHICVSKCSIIGSDNGLSPDRRQAIIWTNARLLSIGPLRTYFNEILIKIQQFSLKKMHVKMSSSKWRPSCLGLGVLNLLPWSSLELGFKFPIRIFCRGFSGFVTGCPRCVWCSGLTTVCWINPVCSSNFLVNLFLISWSISLIEWNFFSFLCK